MDGCGWVLLIKYTAPTKESEKKLNFYRTHLPSAEMPRRFETENSSTYLRGEGVQLGLMGGRVGWGGGGDEVGVRWPVDWCRVAEASVWLGPHRAPGEWRVESGEWSE